MATNGKLNRKLRMALVGGGFVLCSVLLQALGGGRGRGRKKPDLTEA